MSNLHEEEVNVDLDSIDDVAQFVGGNRRASSNTGSIYDELRQELATAPDVEVVWWDVPARPTISIGYLPALDFDLLKSFMKRNNRKDFNPLLFSYQILGYLCQGVRYNDQDVLDDDGQPITFATMLSGKDTGDTISWVYGSDGVVIKTAQELLSLAGYGDDTAEDSPLGI